MRYLALGDSMSTDKNTAVSLFAKLISADQLQNRTQNGSTPDAVIETLAKIRITPDIITLTLSGTDLHQLFTAHGITSPDPWLTLEIEPNHKGATAIAENWYSLYTQTT